MAESSTQDDAYTLVLEAEEERDEIKEMVETSLNIRRALERNRETTTDPDRWQRLHQENEAKLAENEARLEELKNTIEELQSRLPQGAEGPSERPLSPAPRPSQPRRSRSPEPAPPQPFRRRNSLRRAVSFARSIITATHTVSRWENTDELWARRMRENKEQRQRERAWMAQQERNLRALGATEEVLRGPVADQSERWVRYLVSRFPQLVGRRQAAERLIEQQRARGEDILAAQQRRELAAEWVRAASTMLVDEMISAVHEGGDLNWFRDLLTQTSWLNNFITRLQPTDHLRISLINFASQRDI
ncbi:MAG: hypothetical protein M1834_008453 [Cirrosporium novae-zelandiae]|nr:MAG: hypothetical protein M1834_008453 [Cirrosporium novae-zelandiae]